MCGQAGASVKSSFVHGQVLLSIVNFVCIGQVFVCQLGLVM